MAISLILAYLFFCLLIAFFGEDVSVGFWGVLIMSIFLTPLIAAILILIFRPKKKYNLKDFD